MYADQGLVLIWTFNQSFLKSGLGLTWSKTDRRAFGPFQSILDLDCTERNKWNLWKQCQREWRSNFVCTNCYNWNNGIHDPARTGVNTLSILTCSSHWWGFIEPYKRHHMPAPTYECMGDETSHCRQCCGSTACNSLWSSGSIGNLDYQFRCRGYFKWNQI